MREIIIEVKVTPKAKERGLKIGAQGVLHVRTPKPPEGGKANKDVIDMVADHYGVAKSCVTLVSGHTGRKKMLAVMI
jgi:hypothetical protein